MGRQPGIDGGNHLYIVPILKTPGDPDRFVI